MRAFSDDLKTGTAGEQTTLGRLVAIEPVGLPAVYLNSFGIDYVDGLITYLGDPGVVVGDMRISDTGEATLAMEIPVSDEGPVTKEHVTLGLYIDAEVTVEIFDHSSFERKVLGFKWLVGGTSITDDGRASFEIRAATRVRRELILKTYGPGCKNNLGDARCGVDVLGDWTDTVSVVSIVDAYSFTISGARGEAVDDFYANGAIKFTSGDNIDRSYTVRKWDQSGDLVTLWEPLRAGLEAGDDALIHAGCDKTKGAAGCGRFDNFAKRIAFDNLPADDTKFTYQVPAQSGTVTNPEPPNIPGWQGATDNAGGFF